MNEWTWYRRRTAPNYEHSIESLLDHFTSWNSGRLQLCSSSAWRIPVKVFQRPLLRISAAVKKDGAYAESKFQFSCVLWRTRTNQKVWLINVAITTSWTQRDYSSRREFYMRKISLQNHSFKPKVFVPPCALPSLIYWYQDNRFGKCSQSQYQRPKICLVYVFNGLSKIPQSPCTCPLNKSIALSE